MVARCGRVLRSAPMGDTDPGLREFLLVDTATQAGMSGSPVVWACRGESAPIVVGILGGTKIYRDEHGDIVGQVALVARPSEALSIARGLSESDVGHGR